MNYFLDTDVCIFALKERSLSLKKRIMGHLPEQVKIPAMVKAELMFGAHRSSDAAKAHFAVEGLLAPFEIVPFDADGAACYSKIRHELERKGKSIGPNDLIIASIVLSRQGTLVTHNLKEYERVSGLKIQDWAKD